MDKLKSFGGFLIGIAMMTVLVFLVFVFINGLGFVAEKLIPTLIKITTIGTLICILSLPLAFFKKTRIITATTLFISSYVFGLTVWMVGFLVTYSLWGGFGVFIGLMMGGVGVVPLGIIAAVFNGAWAMAGNLLYGIAITFGARIFGMYLGEKS
ncbi:hypothetical protein A2524_00130 [Candidatus Wolfebacteria bacterium RIFOXYD12_FULL_48_21]|uniref:Uncharacterized protein n=1 Tax=Candidatus Wolfebacteria bacterium RIFOXYD1_FULL_48_65 TaxID=1802561 RepID=A0A1F8E3Q6_9BACT|nr:MAG: hypothetical protein A2524_00130 [Candidatus Wolfebacteria bacterium RIFOXYD12_FULL_48_21]OGM95454.1 MAG: hypothetical protein A2610_01015 [Candidatus Wolfebacteria bacterium RIFOXYD1_FULL_48_65]OGM97129.1 MAG: hypothetical protein A2532_03075 [Candidatus Wolfebacteria bacterium RIFOXYD2_FULL_48_11]